MIKTANIRSSIVRVLFGCFAVLLCADTFAAPCVSGNFQSFASLGASGCEVGTVRFTDFTSLPGQPVGTPIDPAAVQVIPGGTASNPMLLFTVNTTAVAGEVFELFLSFSASDSLNSASIDLAPPMVIGDAAVTAILDVCPDGSFAGDPLGCPTAPASLIVFAIEQSSLLSDSANFPGSNSLVCFLI